MIGVVMQHLPVLLVLVPMLLAPLCFLLPRSGIAWALALVTASACFVMSALLVALTQNGEVISYNMGGWEPPWGIEYRIDALNAMIALIVSSMAMISLLYAQASVAREIPFKNQSVFYAAFLLCLTGLLGIALTGDAFNLFVFLEISSLSSYILISMGQDRRALTAAFQYLIMGTIGATLILIGIGFLYMMTGTLNMADLSDRLPDIMGTRTVQAAFAFITVGISIKLALFPLHQWLPNAYGYAPSVVSVFLAAISTKIAVYALLRFTFTVFDGSVALDNMALQSIMLVLAILAIFVGSISAIFQTNIKHLLAYSSVAQIGYIVIGISFATVTGLTGALLHVFNHALIKGGLFMALGCIVYQCGAARLTDFRGLGKTMPLTMAAIVLGGLSLIGVPLTVGFVSKWYLVQAALEGGVGGVAIAVVILLGSVLATAYIWKLVEAAYFQEPAKREKGQEPVREAPLSLLGPTWILIAANIYFGINTDFTVGMAERAAHSLLGVTP